MAYLTSDLGLRNRLAALLGEPHLGAVRFEPEANPGRLAVARVGDGDVGDVEGGFLLDDAAGLARPRRLSLALHQVEPLDDHAVLLDQDRADLAALTAVLA